MRRRYRDRPGHWLGCQRITGEWRANRSVSSLARGAISAVRLPSLTQASAGESPGFHRLLCRGSWQAMMIGVVVGLRYFDSNIWIGSSRFNMTPSRDISRLIEIMAKLRTPVTGCPWDLEQNFQTIAPYTIEEAYEAADAIARTDLDDLREELGDLLLQVVFHARMAQEQGAFEFADVV